MEESEELIKYLDDYNKIILNLNGESKDGGRRPNHYLTQFIAKGV